MGMGSSVFETSSSASVARARLLAGHGRMVDALNETVRIEAANVVMKNVDVAARRVRTDGLSDVSARREDHILVECVRPSNVAKFNNPLQSTCACDACDACGAQSVRINRIVIVVCSTCGCEQLGECVLCHSATWLNHEWLIDAVDDSKNRASPSSSTDLSMLTF